MKKFIYLFALIFATSFFVSCEEEEEPPQTLTEFVLGEWYSLDLMMGDTEAHFLADIEPGQYTLTLVVGDQSAELAPKAYTIDNEASIITIDQPQFPGDEPSEEKIPFKVVWNEGGDTMTWLPVDPLENDAPTIEWIRAGI